MAQIYLVTPPFHRAEEVSARLDFLTGKLPIAAVRLRLAPGYEGPSIISVLKPIIQNRDIALLVEDEIEFAAKAKADGVHLTNYLGVRAARQRLGDEASIGAYCYASRHVAMEAGEAGADYVAFGPAAAPEVIETLKLWADMATLPAIAEAVHDDLAARRVVEAGAEFVCLTLDEADPDALGWLVNR
jgi:thiamine-phosphate pyrophosphorylase